MTRRTWLMCVPESRLCVPTDIHVHSCNSSTRVAARAEI